MFGLNFDQDDPDSFWSLLFEILYSSQGSGLNMTMDDVLRLPMQRIVWIYEQLKERRAEESRAIRAATKRK